MATATQAAALPSVEASTTMPPTGTSSTPRARRAGATCSANSPNTTRAATWVTPMRPAAKAACRSVQPWSVKYGMRWTIAALIAPRSAGQDEGVDRDRGHAQEDGEGDEGGAPAPGVLQGGDRRLEDRRGE